MYQRKMALYASQNMFVKFHQSSILSFVEKKFQITIWFQALYETKLCEVENIYEMVMQFDLKNITKNNINDTSYFKGLKF